MSIDVHTHIFPSGWLDFAARYGGDRWPRLEGDRATGRRLFLGDTFGPERIVLGTDYPFKMGVDDPVGALDPLGLDGATRRRLTVDNARELLAL